MPDAYEIQAENYKDMLRPVEEGDMPVILAKYNGRVPAKYDIRQKHWQGLKKKIVNNKIVWDVSDDDFVLIIEKGTGHCRIPKTPKNEAMFKKYSKTHMEVRTEHNIDPETQELVGIPHEVEVPGKFSRLEENVLQRAFNDSIVDKAVDKAIDKIKENYTLVPKEGTLPPSERDTSTGVVDTAAQKSEAEIRAEIEAELEEKYKPQAEADEIEAIAKAKKAADEAHQKMLEDKRKAELKAKRQLQAENMRKRKEEKRLAQEKELATSDVN